VVRFTKVGLSEAQAVPLANKKNANAMLARIVTRGVELRSAIVFPYGCGGRQPSRRGRITPRQ
jgi:hypothetical protein